MSVPKSVRTDDERARSGQLADGNSGRIGRIPFCGSFLLGSNIDFVLLKEKVFSPVCNFAAVLQRHVHTALISHSHRLTSLTFVLAANCLLRLNVIVTH